jgi:hypothetical protein
MKAKMIYSQTILPVTEVLNQLLRLLCRGLPAYVVEMNPWMQPEHEPLRKALANLDDDRRLYAKRAAQAIAAHGGYPEPGPFRLEYTGLNDVSMEYLTQELVVSLQVDIEILEAISAQLADIPELYSLAEEIIGNTKAHAEILEKSQQ